MTQLPERTNPKLKGPRVFVQFSEEELQKRRCLLPPATVTKSYAGNGTGSENLSRKRCAALAQADVGIAIGAGTDVAIETGRVVLMKSDPSDVLRVIRLSKATITKMKQNLFWASFCNILAIPIAAGILYPNFGIILRPEVSALLMSASSIIVATNAVLLKRAEKNLIAV